MDIKTDLVGETCNIPSGDKEKLFKIRGVSSTGGSILVVLAPCDKFGREVAGELRVRDVGQVSLR